MGTTKVGDFDVEARAAEQMLSAPNPHSRPNSDVLRPFRNGSDLVRRNPERWIVDFGVGTSIETAAMYELPFKHVYDHVRPEREQNNDKWRRTHWWLLGRTLPDFRAAVRPLRRYLATPRVSKHRVFVWQDAIVLPDSKVIATALDADFHFGVLHSRIHEAWTLATCAWHGKGNDPTYNPTECFETFPFPESNEQEKIDIAAAAKELNELRENWLNPPEWTTKRVLEFPGAIDGPWSRFVVKANERGIGTVRYPRIEPRDDECAKKLAKRTLTNLYNERPAWLANAHGKLDAAVASAYNFNVNLTDEAILEWLLALNQERARNEIKEREARPARRVSRAKTAEELV